MNPSIGVAATFHDEHNALPGFLENVTAFFDEVLLVDCSPGAKYSKDPSLDIIQKWMPGYEVPLWDLNEGFGAVRSRLLQQSKTDWTIIMDIDERMNVTMPVYSCTGDQSFPQVEHPQLNVAIIERCHNHRDLLMHKIREADKRGIKAVRFSRRHWFDMTYTRPTQNWTINPDHQLRCIKSRSSVGYTTEPKMHEQAINHDTGRSPDYIEQDGLRGPFLDHFHCHFKKMEVEQRQADIRAYDALAGVGGHTPIVEG